MQRRRFIEEINIILIQTTNLDKILKDLVCFVLVFFFAMSSPNLFSHDMPEINDFNHILFLENLHDCIISVFYGLLPKSINNIIHV